MKTRLIDFIKSMKPKDYVLAISIIVNIILGSWYFSIMREDQTPNEELLKSQGRVQILEQEVEELKIDYSALELINDSLEVELAKKPKERIIIERIRDEKIDNITNMSLDSSISFISTELSKIIID